MTPTPRFGGSERETTDAFRAHPDGEPAPRWIMEQCSDNWVELYPNRATQFCCGAGGGAWITPYEEERLYYGRKKAEQIKATGARLLVVSCHTCYNQFKKSLRIKYDIDDLEVKYLWAMVADAIVLDSSG